MAVVGKQESGFFRHHQSGHLTSSREGDHENSPGWSAAQSRVCVNQDKPPRRERNEPVSNPGPRFDLTRIVYTVYDNAYEVFDARRSHSQFS